MSTRRRYRMVTPKDNSSTVPNRLTFPTGSYAPNNPYGNIASNANLAAPYSNPSTAADGQLGASFSNVPSLTQPGLSQYQASERNRGVTWDKQDWRNTRTASGHRSPYMWVPEAINNPNSIYGNLNGTLAPVLTQTFTPTYGNLSPAGLAQYQTSERTHVVPPPVPTVAAGSSIFGGAQYDLAVFASGGLLPTMSAFQVQQLSQQGLDTGLLAKYYQPDGKGGYKLNQAGLQAQAAANNPSNTASQGGAAPFGVNSAGQRLDASGNVWNPATATTDIYGGKFVQEGARRWGRDERGRLVRQIASGGRWRNQSRKRGGRGGAEFGSSAVAPTAEPQTSIGSATAFINFNTAVG